MKNQLKSTLKTAKVAVAGGMVGDVVAQMMKSGLAWGMSQVGKETNENANPEGVSHEEAAQETDHVNAGETESAPVSENSYEDVNFSEAFASAREELGAGGVFIWKGNAYGTYYKEEWEGMDGEQRQGYWASVNQAEQENEHLAATYAEEPAVYEATQEPEIFTAGTQESPEAEAVEAEIHEEGIHEGILAETSEEEVYEAIIPDTDEEPDMVLVDTDGDGEADGVLTDIDGDGLPDLILTDDHAQDTDHDEEPDDAADLSQEDHYLANPDSYGSDYDDNADVSDMV